VTFNGPAARPAASAETDETAFLEQFRRLAPTVDW